MSDDVKLNEAVKRLKELGRFGGDKFEVIQFLTEQHYQNALEVVVNAALPLLSNEPVTEEYLRAMGFASFEWWVSECGRLLALTESLHWKLLESDARLVEHGAMTMEEFKKRHGEQP